ncbi:MAG: penicillin-binding transpeptidase domain-containing protein [Rhodobacteraceae bacterium]|nr:penicillin-binding transpeptidase domain-containing protein [Paracoccaceae bacterium]
MERFGFGEPVDVLESRSIKPLWPSYWAKSTTATIAYGYGLSITPIHLAAAYASLVNGGYKVEPTILRRDVSDYDRPSILNAETSAKMREMLRLNVEEGSGRQAKIEGYPIGGKTGTSLKIKGGKYIKNKVYAAFAACFPADDPRFVLVVIMDEPQPDNIDEILAGNTVVPVAAEMIMRLSPILGIRPSKNDGILHVASLQ